MMKYPTPEEIKEMFAEDLARINERNTNADFYCSRLQKIACNLADMAVFEKAIDEFEEKHEISRSDENGIKILSFRKNLICMIKSFLQKLINNGGIIEEK